MSSTFSGFGNYRNLSNDLRDKLQKLQIFSNDLHMDSLSKSLEEILEKTKADCFKVAVVGEFKRGKSTLINALLGKSVLPADVMPTTAALNQVTYSPTPGVTLLYKDGHKENVEVDKLAEYVTKLTDEAEERASQIRVATVAFPTDYCRNNVDIIDTPGLNDDATMTEVTLSVLPEIDAALFVIMANSPFSEYERDFLCNKILTSDLGRVLFVVTGIDRLDEEDVERVLDNIRSRIKKYVLEKAKKVMGENSPEYENYQRKIGEPRVFGISAKQALKAKTKGDTDLLTRSQFPAFEHELERFLTEDRGMIALEVRVNKLIAASSEIANTITMRINALEMSYEDFQKKHAEAKQQISDIRQKRQTELDRIKISSTDTFEQLRPLASRFWDEAEGEALALIDRTQITDDMISSKERIQSTSESLMHEVKNIIDNKSRLLSEQADLCINKNIGREIEQLQEFGNIFSQAMNNIRMGFDSTDNSNNSNSSDMVLSTIVGGGVVYFASIMGGGILSGLYMGYREGGWKGMLTGGVIGGVSSAAVTYGTATIGFGIASILGVTAAPVLVGLALIASLTGALSGGYLSKLAVKKLFGNKNIEKIRESLREHLKDEFSEMRKNMDIEQRLQEQVNTIFGRLSGLVYSETENVLFDLEKTLSGLNQQLAEHRGMAEHEKAELLSKMKELNVISQFSMELNKSLLGAMAK